MSDPLFRDDPVEKRCATVPTRLTLLLLLHLGAGGPTSASAIGSKTRRDNFLFFLSTERVRSPPPSVYGNGRERFVVGDNRYRDGVSGTGSRWCTLVFRNSSGQFVNVATETQTHVLFCRPSISAVPTRPPQQQSAAPPSALRFLPITHTHFAARQPLYPTPVV